MDVRGKVALVTGGASGIGLEVCKLLLQEGAKGVSVCDVNTEAGEQRVQDLGEEHGHDRVIFLKCDVTSQSEFEDAFKRTRATFEGLDILVNNAGVSNDKNWELQTDINVNGVIRGILLAYQFMGTNKGGTGGVVINTASTAGLTPGVGVPLYSATKTAVVGLTRAFGHPFYYKDTEVRVMAMCPGVTDSNIAVEDGLLDRSWRPVVEMWFSPENKQPAACVARGMLHMIREGKHGSLWVSLDKQPVVEVRVPDWREMIVK